MQTADQKKNEAIVILYATAQSALFAMGREGANASLTHPLRPAWEECQAALTRVVELDPMQLRAITTAKA